MGFLKFFLFFIFSQTIVLASQDTKDIQEFRCINYTEVPTIVDKYVQPIINNNGADYLKNKKFFAYLCDHDNVTIFHQGDIHYIFFSREIFSKLNHNEIFALVAHEIGHLFDIDYGKYGEMEADQFSVVSLVGHRIPPESFISMLQKVNEVHSDKWVYYRIKKIRELLKNNPPPR